MCARILGRRKENQRGLYGLRVKQLGIDTDDLPVLKRVPNTVFLKTRVQFRNRSIGTFGRIRPVEVVPCPGLSVDDREREFNRVQCFLGVSLC